MTGPDCHAPIAANRPPDDARQWRTWGAAGLRWQNWDPDEFVVYHTGSGDTHLLNAVAAEALRTLTESSLTVEQLAGRVATSLEVPADETFVGQMRQLVADFDELGLIELAC